MKMLATFGEVFEPSEAMEPILASSVRGALTEWLSEIWAEDELAAVGITSRKRAIFDGAPGVGKTTLAHHLAARLGLPMIAVRPERVISKWVGETGQNIGKLFDLAADPENPVVLFLDEFDALSRQRRKSDQAADDSRNQEVNTLLQRIEQYRGFLIAATNFSDHIDEAIWRRFDIHIALDLPGQRERERILERYLSPFVWPAESLSIMAESMETASPALMRKFCEGLKRQTVVGPKIGSDMRKEAVVERLLATIHPHPSAGLPRLWSLGASDRSVRCLPWPMSKEPIDKAFVERETISNIVSIRKENA
jgi:SpoVK/Ycf46/Vps4 family AAA+-type ATPase